MAIEAKVRKIGNSLGIVLPKEVLQTLKVEEGASLYITESPQMWGSSKCGKPSF